MSERIVAIYHKQTREVLGRIPCSYIAKQTHGEYPVFEIAYSNPWAFRSPDAIQINYDVVHHKGSPIKVIADSQRDADILIASQRPSPAQRIASIFNEPNTLLEGLLKV